MIIMKIKTFLHMIAAYLIFCLAFEFSSHVAFSVCDTEPWGEILYVCVDILTVFILVHLYAKYILKKTFQEIYLGKPGPGMKWCIIAVLIPVAICCFYLLFTKGEMRREALTQSEIIQVLCLTILSEGIRAGVTEEVVFRGMIFSSLQKSWGTKSSIFISGLVFTFIHFGNIDTSNGPDVLSLFISITIAGIALALITYETGSIWSSVVVHALYNILAGDGQILHIDTEQNFPAIWTYTFESNNRLLAGIIGADELETGLPSNIGFLIIIIIAVVLIMRKSRMKGRQNGDRDSTSI